MARVMSMESLDKKEAIISQQVINAISKSKKSHEEILRFIRDDDKGLDESGEG